MENRGGTHATARYVDGLVGLLVVTAAVVTALPATAAARTAAHPTTSATEATAPDAGAERGRWNVEAVGADRYTLSWTSPSNLRVTDARPEIVADGAPAGVAMLQADGRTVEVTVESPTAPDVADYDVVLSGQSLEARPS